MAVPLSAVEASVVPRRAAWGLCWLLFASTALCYMDRQAVALVSVDIKAEFRLDDRGYGWVVAAFGMAYALFQVPAGFLADSRDVRGTYALAVAGWSMAGIAAAFSPSLGVLLGLRAMLGVGEGFNWPCALRVTGRILPPADRGLGNGIFNSGAAVGAVLTPLIVPVLAARWGWRAAFVVVGSSGFVWTLVWLAITRRMARETFAPEVPSGGSSPMPRRSAISALVLVAIASATALTGLKVGLPALWWAVAMLVIGPLVIARGLPESPKGPGWLASLGRIVRLRRFWTLAVVSISINVCWHFLANWIGNFFQEERSLGLLRGGAVSALPFLAADAGNLLGGGLSRRLTNGSRSPMAARFLVMGGGAALIASGSGVGLLHRDAAIVALLMVMALGAASFMANYFALCQEVDAARTGLVVGYLGSLGNLFAAGFQPIAGHLKDVTGGLGVSFAIVGLLPIIGMVALAAGWGRDRPEGRGLASDLG